MESLYIKKQIYGCDRDNKLLGYPWLVSLRATLGCVRVVESPFSQGVGHQCSSVSVARPASFVCMPHPSFYLGPPVGVWGWTSHPCLWAAPAVHLTLRWRVHCSNGPVCPCLFCLLSLLVPSMWSVLPDGTVAYVMQAETGKAFEHKGLPSGSSCNPVAWASLLEDECLHGKQPQLSQIPQLRPLSLRLPQLVHRLTEDAWIGPAKMSPIQPRPEEMPKWAQCTMLSCRIMK